MRARRGARGRCRLRPVTAARYAEIAASFDAYAAEEDRWLRRTGGYHDLIAGIARSLVPKAKACSRSAAGAVTCSPRCGPRAGSASTSARAMVAAGRARHPELELHHVRRRGLDLDETFDYIVLTDLIPYVDDLLRLFDAIRRHSHARTRVVVSFHSQLWRPLLTAMAELGCAPIARCATGSRRATSSTCSTSPVSRSSRSAGDPAAVELGPISRVLNGWIARLPGFRALR